MSAARRNLKLWLEEGHVGRTFPRAHGAGERVLPRSFQDRTTASSASPPPYLARVGHLRHKRRMDLQAHLAVLFALDLIGLFGVVPKTDAKPHLFITLSCLLCAANSFQDS